MIAHTCLWRTEEVVRFHPTGATGGCELASGEAGIQLGSHVRQQVLLTVEPSLRTLVLFSQDRVL